MYYLGLQHKNTVRKNHYVPLSSFSTCYLLSGRSSTNLDNFTTLNYPDLTSCKKLGSFVFRSKKSKLYLDRKYFQSTFFSKINLGSRIRASVQSDLMDCWLPLLYSTVLLLLQLMLSLFITLIHPLDAVVHADNSLVAVEDVLR